MLFFCQGVVLQCRIVLGAKAYLVFLAVSERLWKSSQCLCYSHCTKGFSSALCTEADASAGV